MPIAGVVAPSIDTRARARSDQQKGITPCSTLKANLPDSGLDRLCYKNGPFVSSGQIRNPHTRRAYARAATEFFDWLEAKGVTQITAIESVHVATYIEQLQRARSAPTAKLRLAALRHLFDWMVIGQIIPTNPAAAVRGPRHVVRRGRTL